MYIYIYIYIYIYMYIYIYIFIYIYIIFIYLFIYIYIYIYIYVETCGGGVIRKIPSPFSKHSALQLRPETLKLASIRPLPG